MACCTQIIKIEGVFSGMTSYIFNEFSTTSAGGPSLSSVGRVACEKGYKVPRFSHTDTYACADTKLSNVPKEPHPAADLSSTDVEHKLTILSCLVPSLRGALPQGFKSLQTMSLVPPTLVSVSSIDKYAVPIRARLRLSARRHRLDGF